MFYRIDNKTIEVSYHPTAKSANADGNDAAIFSDLAGFEKNGAQITIGSLLAIYNDLADKPIAKFKDKPSAYKRVFALLEAAGAKHVEAEAEKQAGDDASSEAEAGAEASAALEQEAAKAPKAPKVDRRRKENRPEGATAGRRSVYSGKFLYPLSKGNPRREGSFGFRSMAIILDEPGVTTEEYIKRGGRIKDLDWDVKHGSAVAKDTRDGAPVPTIETVESEEVAAENAEVAAEAGEETLATEIGEFLNEDDTGDAE